MSDDNKILNKGLDALLGEPQNNQKTVKELNLNKIKPQRVFLRHGLYIKMTIGLLVVMTIYLPHNQKKIQIYLIDYN